MKAGKAKVTQLLKTARGQIDGILKMIEDDRYCIDISNQLLAVESIIGKANKEVIRGHMHHCVKEAFESGDEEKKIDEIISLIDKMSKR